MTRRTPRKSAPAPILVRSATALVLGVSATVSLAACQWTSPLTTQLQYNPSDGVSGQVGDVHLLNVAVIGATDNGPGTLIGSLDNRGGTEAVITISVADTKVATVNVPARSVVMLSDGAGKVTALPKASAPGTVMQVVFGAASGAMVPLATPVLAPSGPYAGYSPKPASTPTAEPTGSATTPAASATTATTPAGSATTVTAPAATTTTR